MRWLLKLLSITPRPKLKIDPGRQEVFARIFQDNSWGNSESRSGHGSTLARGQDVAAGLLEILDRFPAKVLLDAPCGDFHWMKEVALPVRRYIGLDIVPELIETLRVRFTAPNREFALGDLAAGGLPKADLVFCRDGLVHLSNTDVARALTNVRASGARWLATTSFPAQSTNTDILTGDWRPLNLERAPFNLPPPRFAVSDGCRLPGYEEKIIAVWATDDLPKN